MKSLSIVMALYQARHWLPRVLPPLLEAQARGEVLEVLVVDDGSTDGGPEYCREQGARVLSSGGRLGPGGARNVGVEAARGDIVLFVDSDVIMRPDVPAIVKDAFARDPGCVAVFGSYDDEPGDDGVVSQYLNLRHHYIHHRGNEEASTFWAGCGAVDREAMRAVGGFDAEGYPYPSIEDIELGYRLIRRGGRILLRKDMLCTHLKRWTLRNMVFTDVVRRAIPWTRLMLRPDYEVNDLNVGPAEKLKAILALLLWGSLLVAPFWPAALAGSAALALLAFLVNRGLFLLILRRKGALYMLAGVVLHQVYYAYGVLAYAYCVVEWQVTGRGRVPSR